MNIKRKERYILIKKEKLKISEIATNICMKNVYLKAKCYKD